MIENDPAGVALQEVPAQNGTEDVPSPDNGENWEDYTPPEEAHTEEGNDYSITMYEDGGGIQDIRVTREEYITLKAYLAAMRTGKFSDEQIARVFDVYIADAEPIRAAAVALRNNTGCTTPAEEFLWNILLVYDVAHKKGFGVKPEAIERNLDTFRSNLKDMIDSAQKMRSEYPDLLTEPEVQPA